MRRYVISVYLENESGALSRVAGLFSARGYNIESLTVAPVSDNSLSRLTLVTIGNEEVVEQITKQLNKLVEVVRLCTLTGTPHVGREMILVKVRAVGAVRDEVKRLCDIFRGRIVDTTESSYIVELTGTSDKLDAFIDAIGEENQIEIVRSGVIGMTRGDKALKV